MLSQVSAFLELLLVLLHDILRLLQFIGGMSISEIPRLALSPLVI